MTEREKFMQKKKKEIEKIFKQQNHLIAKGAKLAAKTYKTMPARMRNLGRVMVIMFQVKGLEIQKQLMIAQPFPKFPEGGNSVKGPAIVGDSGKEEVSLIHNHLQP